MGKIKQDPETKYYHFYNANPKGRRTEDCVSRAISTALEIPYNQVVMEMAEQQCKTGYEAHAKKGIDLYLKSKGWVKMSQPRKSDNTKYTGAEWSGYLQACTLINKGSRIVANLGGHHLTCFINGVINDIWDCSTGCVGNYWVKE